MDGENKNWKPFYGKWNDYKDYLSSAHWASLREQKFKQHGHYCNKCKAFRKLQVHHKSYENFPDVGLDNLEVLCRKCHKLEHFPCLKQKPVKQQTQTKRKKKEKKAKVQLINKGKTLRFEKRSCGMTRFMKVDTNNEVYHKGNSEFIIFPK